MQIAGLVFGLTAFLSIWLGHVAVRELEYRLAWLPWPLFLIAGLAALAVSFAVSSRLLSGSLGILGITLLWDALECVRQQRRVVRGHAPANPRNARHRRLVDTHNVVGLL
jgi:hypothetical protein